MSFTWFHTLAFVRPKVLQALQRRGKVHKNSEHILFATVSMLHHREANGHGLVWMQLCSVSALLNLKFCIEQAREILCQSHPADQISTIALLALRVAYWGLTDWHHLTSIATFQGLSIAHDSESWKSGHLGQSRSLALPDSPKTCTSDGMGLAAVNASRALLRETCPPMLWNKLVHITILHHITILYIYIYT